MRHDTMMYKAFLAEYKVLEQCHPRMSKIEVFIRAIVATSDDKYQRAKRVNPEKIEEFKKNKVKKVFSDALTRRI